MILRLKTERAIHFAGRNLSFQPWDATAEPGTLVEWPIIVKYNGEYVVLKGEWGLTSDHYLDHDTQFAERTNNIGFEIDISLAGDLQRCIIPTDSGFMPGVRKTWIDNVHSDIVETFAVCTSDEEPLAMTEGYAIDWLRGIKSPA